MNWLNPYVWLAALIGALASFGSGLYLGYDWASSACVVQQAKAQQAAQSKADETNTRREQVAQQREVTREQIRVVYRTIKERADETPITHAAECGLSADGLRLWNAANSATTEGLRGQPERAVPAAATADAGHAGSDAAQPCRGDGAVCAMPRSTGETGGVR